MTASPHDPFNVASHGAVAEGVVRQTPTGADTKQSNSDHREQVQVEHRVISI